MAFPSLIPSKRSFDAGDYPVKSFRSQSGVEARILYGSRRTGGTLKLDYENIPDANANLFIAHFEETKGTFSTFALDSNTSYGWDDGTIDAGVGNQWRYSNSPQITNIRPGVSSVSVELIAVL
jgi:hypothetical protein